MSASSTIRRHEEGPDVSRSQVIREWRASGNWVLTFCSGLHEIRRHCVKRLVTAGTVGQMRVSNLGPSVTSTATLTALIGVIVFILAAMIGPLFSHPNYSSLAHTTSELAGQGMPNAWIMRSGFATFGACTAFAAAMRLRDSPVSAAPLIVFGASMLAASIWSNAPIDRTAAHSIREDEFHSIAASLMGVAFAAACSARLCMNGFSVRDSLSWLALAASIGLPLGMVAFPSVDGGLQRVMFAISFVWIVRELRPPARTPKAKR